jgi:Raf kinase inhibitor-like YbhB/YbcL family protein
VHWVGRRGLTATALLLGVSLLSSGCGLVSGPAPLSKDAPLSMEVSSPAVTRAVLPAEFTCYAKGKPKTPPVFWQGAPSPRTKSFALVFDDSGAPISPWVYWLVFDIGRETTDIGTNMLPPSANQARNSTGATGYEPPCPVGSPHKYRIAVYALDTASLGGSVTDGAQLLTTWTTIAPHVLARGTMTVTVCPPGAASQASRICRAAGKSGSAG